MRASQRLIVEAVYASWAAQDLSAVAACLHRDAVYTLHLPKDAWSISGDVCGRQKIIASLADILRDFEVLEYRPLKIADGDGISTSRAKIHYGHRATGLSYEATIRNVWRIQGDKVRHFEVFHDAARLRAFYEMVNRMSVEA
ncbi:MAG: nuclear transport factor 2 family protein [Hyphomonadaceae bacterium]|jgi:ketosteroid isomerase-like protein|nr:nuclear transport factor 2 family protein [Hyphomonadaceae bacterium]